MASVQEITIAPKTDKATIMFACPTYGPIHRKVYAAHLSLLANTANSGLKVHLVAITSKMGLAAASNELTRVAIASKVDYVFWTEMDMLPPHDAITKLYEHAIKYDIDVLSGVYFLRGTAEPCLYIPLPDKWTENKFSHGRLSTFPVNSIFPIGCPGVGCVLIKREVFEKMQEPWWDDQAGGYGTDIYFYTKARQAGVKVYADSSVICDQIDEDEPTVYGIQQYNEWMKTDKVKGGFIFSDYKNAIQL